MISQYTKPLTSRDHDAGGFKGGSIELPLDIYSTIDSQKIDSWHAHSYKCIMNHLRHEKSPYLLQHADNPVDWYAWGEEAFAKARAEDKPVFLSIGYSTCHWCHVMAHESFEDKGIAQLMNEAFVNIKVDREERPDIDSLYMGVCQALTGSGFVLCY